MLRGGASFRHVRELLGHSSIDTMQDYIRVVIDDLQKSHSRAAPGNRRQEKRLYTLKQQNCYLAAGEAE
ncbi:MAG: hypothetical protein CML13_01390 [Puniceicoccaceae bacterium]|nr:hypothetical protein [Puniceicoccaceae bacterium]|tara:strand:+ start:245 stop:451 length:207 start_codon:yes stop_codon:yes gene_type:complete